MTEPSKSLPRRLTQGERLSLLEEDSRAHAKSLSVIVEQMQGGFNETQLAQIKAAFREELADAGLRLDGADHQDEAREDFRWLRRTRLAWDGAANGIGKAILTAALVICGAIIASGFVVWLQSLIKQPPT